MPALIDLAFNEFLGGLAVTFFFTLSGFLITTLLLAEKRKSGTIALRSFFKRRARRIWPLYYLTLAVGYGLSLFWLKDIPHHVIRNGFVLNLLLLPNLVFALGVMPDILIQIWSIGTEEQFYLVWPFLLKRTRTRNLLPVFAGVIGFFILARIAVAAMGKEYSWLHILLFRTRIDCMAIGGLAALLLGPGGPASRASGLSGGFAACCRFILRPVTGWLAGIGFVALLILSYRFRISLYQCYAVLSGILILRLIHKPVRWLESAVPRYLGKISYGIYLLQQFVIFFLFMMLVDASPVPTATNNRLPATAAISTPLAGIGIYLLAVLLTVALASLSYFFFERPFMKR